MCRPLWSDSLLASTWDSMPLARIIALVIATLVRDDNILVLNVVLLVVVMVMVMMMMSYVHFMPRIGLNFRQCFLGRRISVAMVLLLLLLYLL